MMGGPSPRAIRLAVNGIIRLLPFVGVVMIVACFAAAMIWG
jgi:hypothetical protein